MEHEIPGDQHTRTQPWLFVFITTDLMEQNTDISTLTQRSPERPTRAEQGTSNIVSGQTFSSNKTTITVHHSAISPLITTPVTISTR